MNTQLIIGLAVGFAGGSLIIPILFPLAACIALLRAHGVTVGFTEGPIAMFLCSTGKLKRGARWSTDTERKPKKRYTCGWCGKRTCPPYRWVDGAKGCHKCNVAYGDCP